MKHYAVFDAKDAVHIEPLADSPHRGGVTLREAFRQARQVAGWGEGGREICRRCAGAGCGYCDGEGEVESGEQARPGGLS